MKRVLIAATVVAAGVGATYGSAAAQWQELKAAIRPGVATTFEDENRLVIVHRAMNVALVIAASEDPQADLFASVEALRGGNPYRIWVASDYFLAKGAPGSLARRFFSEPFVAAIRYRGAAGQTMLTQLDTASEEKSPDTGAKEDAGALLDTWYEEAQEARTAGKLEVARVLLKKIEARKADFKDIVPQLAEIEVQLKNARLEAIQSQIYETGRGYENEGKLEMAVAVYENLLETGEYRDARDRIFKLKETMQARVRQQQLERNYDAGMVAMRNNDWSAAALAFEEVIKLDPQYRSVRNRLAQVREALDNERRQLVSSQQPEAEDDPEPAEPANEEEIAATDEPAAEPEKPADTRFAPLLNSAIKMFEAGDYSKARTMLTTLLQLDPDNQQAVVLLAEIGTRTIRADDNIARAAAPGGRENPYLLGALVLASVVVPILGFLFMSPSVRARTRIMLGDYNGAAGIYQKMLRANPDRFDLYPKLADLYLLSGRIDREVLMIFEKIIQLNLQVPNRKKIELILQGAPPKDQGADAISILEAALKEELRKL